MPIRLGVVGLSKNGGWAATDLIPPILEKPLSDRFALMAVSTSSPASAAASASHYSGRTQGEVKAYHGATDAISVDPNVDLVVVSIRVTQHAEAAIPAIRAGKNVFVEWPLGRNLDEARSLAQAAKGAGVRTMVGLQSWSVPAYRKAKEWIDAGRIGRVLSTSWYAVKSPEVGIGSPWTHSKYEYALDAKHGATFLDIPIGHTFSAITHVLGPLRTVNTTTTIGSKSIIVAEALDSKDARVLPNDQPDQFAVSGVFESGALFSGTWLQLSKTLPPGQPATILQIFGTEGTIRIESEALFFVPPTHISLNDQKFDLTQDNAAKSATARAWEAYANGEEGTYATFEDAVDLHRLIAAIRKSDKEGRRIDIKEI